MIITRNGTELVRPIGLATKFINGLFINKCSNVDF